MPTHGTLVAGRYRRLDILGDGGMARVFRAEDTRLHRVVALKTLHPQYLTQPRFVQRFEQEAQLAAGLAHPHIVAIYDVGRDGETYYIVMEYVAGGSLKHLLARAAPLAPERVVALMRQLGSALDAAHAHGIIHRDIKPENILLTPTGQVKVTDFGIARALGGAGQTTTGMVLGSACYFSPEQAQGQPATAESDLYSSGVVLYELLTGRLPFVAETALATALQQVAQPPPPPCTLLPALPAAVDAVVLRALHKDPARRFHTGAELAEALARALTPQAAPLHRAPTLLLPLPRHSRPARRRVAVLALLLVLAAGSAYAATALGPGTPAAGGARTAAAPTAPRTMAAQGPRPHTRAGPRPLRSHGAVRPHRAVATATPVPDATPTATAVSSATPRPAQPPMNPTALHVTSGSCAVHWIVWTWRGAQRAMWYEVVLYDPRTGATVRSTRTQGTSYTLAPGPGATVALKVRSRNAAGTAPTFFTPGAVGRVPLAAPNPTRLTASTRGHTITWSWPAMPQASAYDFVLYHYSGRTAKADITGRTTVAHWSVSVTPGITYYLKVRTVGPCAPAGYYTPSTRATAGARCVRKPRQSGCNGRTVGQSVVLSPVHAFGQCDRRIRFLG